MLYMLDEEKTLVLMVGILLVVYLLLIGFGIANYIMNAVALQKIASKRLIPNSWLAWIPVANLWVTGSIADEYDEKNGIKRKWRVTLLVLHFIAIGGLIIGYVGFVALIVALSVQPDIMDADITGLVGGFVGAYVLVLVAALIAAAQNICNMICLYKIYESTVPEKSVKYLLLSLLVPLAKGICLLKCRNQGYEKVIVPEVYPTYTEPTQEALPEETISEEVNNIEETNSEE